MSESSEIREVILKPRVLGPIIKICFEIYHALRPFHHLKDDHFPSLKRSAVFLFFTALRWYFFMKRLLNDKMKLNSALTIREKLSLFIALLGHLLMIWAQKTTINHETQQIMIMNNNNDYDDDVDDDDNDNDNDDEQDTNLNVVNDKGPYGIIRHPHHLGKWLSEAFVAVYQDNKVSIAINFITLGFTLKRANKEEADYQTKQYQQYEAYKRKVPNKFFPGIY